MGLNRTLTSYGYLALVAALVVIANVVAWPYDEAHPDSILLVLSLTLGAALMNAATVDIERGRLSLNAIVIGASATLLNPLDTTIVASATAFTLAKRGRWSILGNVVVTPAWACAGSLLAAVLRHKTSLPLEGRVGVLVVTTIAGWITVALGFRVRTGEPIPSIFRHSFTPSFYAAYAYFGLAALLLSYVLDGSLVGYLLAAIVCVLSLALTDTIAGRRVRRVLESELSDADRHLFHSRAVEGVVHNLRNHVATAAGYLKEIDSRRLDPVDRESLETAAAATSDAVTVLRGLSQGATPRVSYSPDPVDLNELVARAVGMARPRARVKEEQLATRESAEDVKVRADPLLMREVITNLLNNAIDAAPRGGHVTATTGRRSGRPYLSISDNGPGISDDHRHRLFEPHFTTKEDGTGLGLFMSYGIVREHQGQLLFEGNRPGAVFTVVLPPFSG
jgi:signal transduction histidine kinase